MGPRTEQSAGQRRFFFAQAHCGHSFWHPFLKVIATSSNLPASVGSRSMESVYFCFPIAPQDI